MTAAIIPEFSSSGCRYQLDILGNQMENRNARAASFFHPDPGLSFALLRVFLRAEFRVLSFSTRYTSDVSDPSLASDVTGTDTGEEESRGETNRHQF